jgi:hypothetical protein
MHSYPGHLTFYILAMSNVSNKLDKSMEIRRWLRDDDDADR